MNVELQMLNVEDLLEFITDNKYPADVFFTLPNLSELTDEDDADEDDGGGSADLCPNQALLKRKQLFTTV